MKYQYEIPATFWGLFRSANREIYIEALLAISEEYEYSNYFLSKEACLQVLSDMCSVNSYAYEWEDPEDELGLTLPRRILQWLLRTGWLRKVEDFNTLTTNIVIPDYSAVMIEAFERMINEPFDDTQVYIQNVYATLLAFRSDPRMNLSMLKTALVNTRKLNKVLQDMLHNMDKFFGKLLEAEHFGSLLKEHLDGYVEEVVRKKYHILKTSDNFYIYKMDIRRCLKEMREDEEWLKAVRERARSEGSAGQEEKAREGSHNSYKRHRGEDVCDLIDLIERGFEDIEHRIANMDKEHSKYVRATVSRLNYLLTREDDRKGLLVRMLTAMSSENGEETDRNLVTVSEMLRLSGFDILHESPLYKRRNPRRFEELVEEMEPEEELNREDVLQLNRINSRYTRQQIEDFVTENMTDGILDSGKLQVDEDEAFEKLILAYDLCTRRNSAFEVRLSERTVENGRYQYPEMIFVKKERNEG